MTRAAKILKRLLSLFLRAWRRSKVTVVTLVVALTLAMFSPALAANGQNLILGNASNAATALTRLSGNVAGPALQVINNNAAANATALNLATRADRPPMRVNSATKVTNLNSDKLDGQDSSAFLPINGTAANATNAANADKLDGKDASQLEGAPAYAHINANGDIDPSRSKNFNRSDHTDGPGLYCINTTVQPHNVVATIEGVANGSASDFGQISLHSNNGAAECIAGTTTYNISVSTGNKDGVKEDRAFDIVIN